MRGRLLSAETRLNVLHRRKGPLTTKSLQRSWSFEHKLLAIAKAQLLGVDAEANCLLFVELDMVSTKQTWLVKEQQYLINSSIS
jgi:hypothetical protein